MVLAALGFAASEAGDPGRGESLQRKALELAERRDMERALELYRSLAGAR